MSECGGGEIVVVGVGRVVGVVVGVVVGGLGESSMGVAEPLASTTSTDQASVLIVIKPAIAAAIDQAMERASHALVSTEYFLAEGLCLKAMHKALRAKDYERLARICLPLQEARRQNRHLATDTGLCQRVDTLPKRGEIIQPGCYLLEPPLVGWDGHRFRVHAHEQRVPVLVLVKEPTTSRGMWPVVGVGEGAFERVVARVQVAPPKQGDDAVPDASWFLAAQEALGDAAIAKAAREPIPAYRVEDLVELLDAVPDHEKLSQALAATAREAMTQPVPARPRRRPIIDNPHSF